MPVGSDCTELLRKLRSFVREKHLRVGSLLKLIDRVQSDRRQTVPPLNVSFFVVYFICSLLYDNDLNFQNLFTESESEGCQLRGLSPANEPPDHTFEALQHEPDVLPPLPVVASASTDLSTFVKAHSPSNTPSPQEAAAVGQMNDLRMLKETLRKNNISPNSFEGKQLRNKNNSRN